MGRDFKHDWHDGGLAIYGKINNVRPCGYLARRVFAESFRHNKHLMVRIFG